MSDSGSHPVRRPGPWALALLVVALLIAVSGIADRASQEHADTLFQRALVTFGTARALDAVISAAQGTEIALSPAGMGVTLSAGELLDPLNDLVEQFATIVLLAATSLGMQAVALRISAWWGITLLLLVAAGSWAWLGWRGSWPQATGFARRALVVLLALRFAVPAVTLASYWVFDVFLAPEQEAALEVLETTREEVGALAEVGGAEPSPQPDDRSWTQRLREWVGSAPGTAGIQARLEAFRDQIGAAVEHMVRLIVIFVLQTIVLPLLLLWVAGRVVGSWLG